MCYVGISYCFVVEVERRMRVKNFTHCCVTHYSYTASVSRGAGGGGGSPQQKGGIQFGINTKICIQQTRCPIALLASPGKKMDGAPEC